MRAFDARAEGALKAAELPRVTAQRAGALLGDDSQAIYSFRGASFENIIRFPERYPDATVFNLEGVEIPTA